MHGKDGTIAISVTRDPWEALADALKAVWAVRDEEQARPNSYINGDDGYHWLTCNTCEEPLLCVDAGDDLTKLIEADRDHVCTEKADS